MAQPQPNGVWLPFLEFDSVQTDSPAFRDAMKDHEASFDRLEHWLKSIGKEQKNAIASETSLQSSHRSLAQLMTGYETVTLSTPTQEEILLDGALQRFADIYREMEESRETMIMQTNGFVKEIDRFRKEDLSNLKEERKAYQKLTDKYYSALEKFLSLSPKRKESILDESESQIDQDRDAYLRAGLEYVQKVNDMQKLRKFDVVEKFLSHIHATRVFYHQTLELMHSYQPYLEALAQSLQNARDRYGVEREMSIELMNEMETSFKDDSGRVKAGSAPSRGRKEGYLFIQKRHITGLGYTWGRYYCQFDRLDNLFKSPTCDAVPNEGLHVDACTQRPRDTTDRRYCFEITSGDKVLVLQALTEGDRKNWMSVLGGLDPVKTIRKKRSKHAGGGFEEKVVEEDEGNISPQGVAFVQRVIAWVEKFHIDSEGIYRLSGQKSKFLKLYSESIEKGKKLNFDDEDSATVTSALKHYLREMKEPLLTSKLYQSFVDAAKIDDESKRREELRGLIHSLPTENFQVLELIVRHLRRIAEHAGSNKMMPSNLAVVFGPTLLRSSVESVGAIMNIKYQNVIVENLINDVDYLFAYDSSDTDAPMEERDPSPGGSKLSLTTSPTTPASTTPPTPAPRPVVGPRVLPPRPAPPSVLAKPQLVTSQSSNPSLNQTTPPSSTSATPTSPSQPYPRPPLPPSQTSKPALINIKEKSLPNLPVRPDPAARKATVRARTFKAKYNCEGEDETELSFEMGDVFTQVVPSEEEGWLRGLLLRTGKRGLVPANYLEEVFLDDVSSG